MASKASSASTFPPTPLLNEFTARVRQQDTPAKVLDVLHDLASKHLPLSVLGAARFPIKASDWRSTRLGEMCSYIPPCPTAGGRSIPPWPCKSTTLA